MSQDDFCSFKAYILVVKMDKKVSNSDNTVVKRKHKKAITWVDDSSTRIDLPENPHTSMPPGYF